jgi:hypothetical protein
MASQAYPIKPDIELKYSRAWRLTPRAHLWHETASNQWVLCVVLTEGTTDFELSAIMQQEDALETLDDLAAVDMFRRVIRPEGRWEGTYCPDTRVWTASEPEGARRWIRSKSWDAIKDKIRKVIARRKSVDSVAAAATVSAKTR